MENLTKVEILALLGDANEQKTCSNIGIIIPCPACYKRGKLISSTHDQYYVCCSACGLSTKTYNTKEEAIRQWNKRSKFPNIYKNKKGE